DAPLPCLALAAHRAAAQDPRARRPGHRGRLRRRARTAAPGRLRRQRRFLPQRRQPATPYGRNDSQRPPTAATTASDSPCRDDGQRLPTAATRASDIIVRVGRLPTLLERLGISLPVLQAGMGGGLAGARLAAAVSEAGGLGTIGILPPESLRRELAR